MTTTPEPMTTTTPEPVVPIGSLNGMNRMIPVVLTEDLMDEMLDSGIVPVL